MFAKNIAGHIRGQLPLDVLEDEQAFDRKPQRLVDITKAIQEQPPLQLPSGEFEIARNTPNAQLHELNFFNSGRWEGVGLFNNARPHRTFLWELASTTSSGPTTYAGLTALNISDLQDRRARPRVHERPTASAAISDS